jgi:hypothetical protein
MGLKVSGEGFGRIEQKGGQGLLFTAASGVGAEFKQAGDRKSVV